MKIKVYFNDHCLDDEIEGFITLGIDGRNFSGLELSKRTMSLMAQSSRKGEFHQGRLMCLTI